MTESAARGYRDDEVIVEPRGDDVRIAPERTDEPPGLRSALAVRGGLLTFDIRNLDSAPSLVVIDAGAVSEWLHVVYGAAVADAFALVATDREARRAAFSPSPATRELARLALGVWILRWWPSDRAVTRLDADLLRVELAALASHHLEVLGGVDYEGLFREGDVAAALVRAIDLGAEPAFVQAAARAALDHWRAGDVRRRGVEEIADLLAGADEDDDRTFESDPLARFRRPMDAAELGLPEEYALTSDAGADAGIDDASDGLSAIDRSSVDWAQVPPRVVDWSEDTVVASLRGRTVRVRVAAAAGARPIPLFARIYRLDRPRGEGLPLARIPLMLVDGRFEGEAELPEALDIHSIAIDVYASHTLHPPVLDDRERDDARAAREAARTIILARARAVRRTRAGQVSGGAVADRPDRLFLAELS